MPSGKLARLRAKIENDTRNWNYSDLKALLDANDFDHRKGNHGIVFVHNIHRELRIVIPKKDGLAPDYPQAVRRLLNKLEEIGHSGED